MQEQAGELGAVQAKAYKIMLIVAVVGLALLLLSNQQTLRDTWELLKTLDPRLLILLPIIQLINYGVLANYYRAFMKSLGYKLPMRMAYGYVSALAFVNQILPSGGLSGLTYLTYGWRKIAPVGVTTVVQIGRYVLAFTSYVLMISAAAIMLLLGDDLNFRVLLVMSLLMMATVIGAGFFHIIVAGKKTIDRLVIWVSRGINKLASWLSDKYKKKNLIEKKAVKKVLKDFHKRVDSVITNKRHVFWPGLNMVLSTTLELSIVYMSFLAIGVVVNPGIIILSFAAANIVGVISVIPGDVGVHELTMIFVLSSFGVDSAAALSAILLYRVFNKVLMLPIGFYFYSTLLKPITQATR